MTFNSYISPLLIQVNSRINPLSQSIAEALIIARNIGNSSLDDFCTKELQGWNPEDEPRHRIIQGFASFENIESSQFAEWRGTVGNIFSSMQRHPNFYTTSWFIITPISQIESRQNLNTDNRFYINTTNSKNVFLESAMPEKLIFLYAEVEAYLRILEVIRTELTKRLLGLVTPEERRRIGFELPES